MNMMDWFQALTRGQDPNSAIVPSAFDARSPSESAVMDPNMPGSAMAPPSGGAPNARAGLMAHITQGLPQGPPQGVPSPVTNPKPPQETPKAYESPPDLANMYLQMMQQNQNAAALDRNLSLIAAGFSKYPEARAALMHRAGGGGAAAGQMTAADFVNIQKIQQNQKDQLLWGAAKRGLMKQYDLSQEEVDALGPEKMGDIIKHHNTQNLVQVTDQATGQTIFADASTGKEVARVGGKKPKEGQFIETPSGKQLMSPETGLPMGPAVGAPPEEGEFVDTPEGRQLMSKRTGQPMGPAAGRLPEKEELEFADINKGRLAARKPAMTREEYVKLKKSGVTVNVGPTGTPFPDPEKGHAYMRNEDGSVKVDAEGKPMQYKLPGGPTAEEAVEKTKKEMIEARNRYASVSSVAKAVDDSLDILDETRAIAPSAGLGSSVMRQFGGTQATNLQAKLRTIDAVTAFKQLQDMRAASTTGASGLGSVTDFEQRMLSSVMGNTDPNQDPRQLRATLIRVKAAMQILAENDFKKQAGGDEKKAVALYGQALEREIADIENSRPKGQFGKSKIMNVRPSGGQ